MQIYALTSKNPKDLNIVEWFWDNCTTGKNNKIMGAIFTYPYEENPILQGLQILQDADLIPAVKAYRFLKNTVINFTVPLMF